MFYIKITFKKKFRKSLFENILIDQKAKLLKHFNQPINKEIINKKTLIIVIKQFLYFLLFFVFIRLFRTDIIDEVKKIDFIKSNTSAL
jgi:hypothetical protein